MPLPQHFKLTNPMAYDRKTGECLTVEQVAPKRGFLWRFLFKPERLRPLICRSCGDLYGMIRRRDLNAPWLPSRCPNCIRTEVGKYQFASYCAACGTGDPGEDYCASCGERLPEESA